MSDVSSNSRLGDTRNVNDEADAEEEFDDLLRAMKTDLLDLNRLNNARSGYLHRTVLQQRERDAERKRMNDENTQLLSKYNLLLKRQKELKRQEELKRRKESKRNAKHKSSNNKDDKGMPLPW